MLAQAPALVAHFRTVHSGEVGGLVLRFRVVEILSEKIVVGARHAARETPLERVWRLEEGTPKPNFVLFVSNRAFAEAPLGQGAHVHARGSGFGGRQGTTRRELVTFHGSRNCSHGP